MSPFIAKPPLTFSKKDLRAYVLYVDHQGHPAPLDESYHATASRRLSSSIINRGYPSTINHVDSAYCPQCLTVYTEIGPGGGSITMITSSSTNTGLSSSSSSSNAGGYYCTKPGCKLCPVCLSVVSIHVMKNDDIVSTDRSKQSGDIDANLCILFGCGNCGWSSDICSVYVPMSISASDSNKEIESDPASIIGRLEMTRAVNDLQSELLNRKRTDNELLDQYWTHLTSMWTEESYQQNQSAKSPSSSSRARGGTNPIPKSLLRSNNTAERRRQRRNDQQEWTIEQLNESLNEKKKKLMPKLQMLHEQDLEKNNENKTDLIESSQKQTIAGMSVRRIPVHSLSMEQLLETSAKNHNIAADSGDYSFLYHDEHIPLLSYNQQTLNTPLLATDVETGVMKDESKKLVVSTLLPLMIPLRLRTSRRCRMELHEGRPGILLKPKLNPLEGDSSLRTGQGQWYKKDCSAIAIIPRVDIIEHHQYCYEAVSSEQQKKKIIVILLRVSNPTLGTVRLRLGPSQYDGEPILFPEVVNDSADKNKDLQDLVVDTIRYSLKPTIVDAQLQTETFATIEYGETVELLSAEDSIIELGAVRARETPKQALDWHDDHHRIVEEERTNTTTNRCSIRLVAHNSSDAWFEVMGTTVIWQEDLNKTAEVTTPSRQHDEVTTSPFVAFPIAMQVELGNGSWESSLIPPSTSSTTSDITDHVTFDLVLVLPETTFEL